MITRIKVCVFLVFFVVLVSSGINLFINALEALSVFK